MKKQIKAAIFLARCGGFLLVGATSQSSFAQGTFVYDQQSATNGLGQTGTLIQSSQAVGQSFTPAASLIGFAILRFGDSVINNGVGSTLVLSLRESAIDGSELAVSAPVTLRDNYFGAATFLFPLNIAVTPGTPYFLVPTLQSGDDTAAFGDFYNYGGGTAYYKSQPSSAGLDLWFREGFIVPEPSVWSLALAGAGVAAWMRRKISSAR